MQTRTMRPNRIQKVTAENGQCVAKLMPTNNDPRLKMKTDRILISYLRWEFYLAIWKNPSYLDDMQNSHLYQRVHFVQTSKDPLSYWADLNLRLLLSNSIHFGDHCFFCIAAVNRGNLMCNEIKCLLIFNYFHNHIILDILFHTIFPVKLVTIATMLLINLLWDMPWWLASMLFHGQGNGKKRL